MRKLFHRPKENPNMARPLTKEPKVNRSFKAVGRKLGPTYAPGRVITHNKVEATNEASRMALERINAKHKGTGVKKPLYVDSKLGLHD